MKDTIIISGIVALIMSAVMSFVMTAVNVGFPPFFLQAWLKGVGISFLVAWPLSVILPPLVTYFVKRKRKG